MLYVHCKNLPFVGRIRNQRSKNSTLIKQVKYEARFSGMDSYFEQYVSKPSRIFSALELKQMQQTYHAYVKDFLIIFTSEKSDNWKNL